MYKKSTYPCNCECGKCETNILLYKKESVVKKDYDKNSKRIRREKACKLHNKVNAYCKDCCSVGDLPDVHKRLMSRCSSHGGSSSHMSSMYLMN